MIVALGTFKGHPQPDIGCGLHPVDHIFHPELFGNGPAFIGGGMVAVKAGSDFLFEGSLGQEIARDLLDGEFIEGFVVAVSVEHPVSPGPHIARAIVVKHGGVAVAGGIHPYEGHAFGIFIGSKQSVDQFFVSVGRLIGQEFVDLIRAGGESG